MTSTSETWQKIEDIKGAKIVRSFCYSCPWQCPSEVYVKDNKVVYVKGNQYAQNEGARCSKGMASAWVTRDPDRLKHPMLRVGPKGSGSFERISWKQAYEMIAEKLADIKAKYGPESVVYLYHQDPNGVFAQVLLSQLYGTPNFYGHTSGCEQDRRLACLTIFGHVFPVPDYEFSKYIMLWGMNPLEANGAPAVNKVLFKAINNGARLVVVDPILTQTAEKADEWIPIKPGTDGALALAMCKVIIDEGLYDDEFVTKWTSGFEGFRDYLHDQGYTPEWAARITGIDAERIIRLSRELATAKPAIVEVFKGPGYYNNGTDASRAIYLLNVLTGNVDGPGNLHLKDWAPVGPPMVIPSDQVATPTKPPLHIAMGYPLAPDLPTGLLPDAVLEGKPYPVKAIFVHATNPVMSDMNTKRVIEMFRALEFSVAIELYMSETALECDLVLPETSFYERAELRQGLVPSPEAILCQPAIEPIGESKPMYDIVKELAAYMDFGEFFTYDTWEDWAKVSINGAPFDLEYLKEHGFWDGPMKYYKFKETGFPTPSGKLEIYSKNFADNGYNPYPTYTEPSVTPENAYPLQLVNNKIAVHSNLITQNNPYLMEIMGENWSEINPADAILYGVKDGDLITIESSFDTKTIKLKLNEGVRPGVICVRHGHGFGHWASGSIAKGKGTHINSLIGSQVTPISGGNAYNECKVRISKA